MKARLTPQHQPPDNPQPQSSPDWCTFGKCKEMPAPNENVCCRERPCLSTNDSFAQLVLQTDVLSIAIVHSAVHYVTDAEYTPVSYRKAAYGQWTVWQVGYLGRSNQRLIPSCIVWAVHDKYPAPHNNYLGFKEY